MRIKCKDGPTYLVTTSQETASDLLTLGEYIYRRRDRVEPSRTQVPIPIRCEKCQSYNSHNTAQYSKKTICGFCTGSHPTRQCRNMQLHNYNAATCITLPSTLQDPNTTLLLITLTHHPDLINIATRYSSPQTNIDNSIPLLKHLEQYKNIFLIAGLNSQHPMMRDRKTDDNGKILFQYSLKSPLIDTNVSPTRFVNNLESAADRILISPATSNKLVYKVVQKTCHRITVKSTYISISKSIKITT